MAENALGKTDPRNLINYFLISLLIVDFYVLTKINYVTINDGLPDWYAISLILTLLAWCIYLMRNRSFTTIIQIKEGLDKTKNFLIFLMALYSIPLVYAVVFHGADIGDWNIILPLHMTLSAYFLISGKTFESNLWTPIRLTIDDLIRNSPGSIITMYPNVDDSSSRVKYYWKADRESSHSLIADLTIKNTPFLIKDTNLNHLTTVYQALNYDGLNETSRLNLPLSRGLINRQYRTALSHILIWHLFELYLDEDFKLEIPYNIKRGNSDLVRLKSEEVEYNSELLPFVDHMWNYEKIVIAGGYIFDIIRNKDFSSVSAVNQEYEHDFICFLFQSGLKYYHYNTAMDDTLLLCHFILLSSRFERDLEEKFWITINSTFAEAARIILTELKTIKSTSVFNEKIGENTRRLTEEIQVIRLKPIENFIKYYDQIVMKINDGSTESNEEELEDLQRAFDGLIGMMNNQLNRTEYSLQTQEHALDRRQYRKEIVSGITLGLFCLVHRTTEV
jgi:hypothetical protein